MARRTKAQERAVAVGYVRVSTTEQADVGVSLAAQERAVRAYCELRGVELLEVVVDAGVSASIPLGRRPGGSRVVELLASGDANAVVAMKLDRLFRDALDCLSVSRDWDRADIAMHLVDLCVDTKTALGRLFLTMIAAVAEMERNLIGERTSAALSHLRSQGVVLGGEGLGWRRSDVRDDHGRLVLVEDTEELETVARIRALRAEGLTLRSVAERLTQEGRPTKRGGRWFGSTVRAVLRRTTTDVPRRSRAATASRRAA